MTQERALSILKTGANIFLTGEPGAGKTYTITSYIQYLRAHGIEPAITASTGIAATHIHGQTIHSWSGIGIKRNLSPYDIEKIVTTEYIHKRIKKTKVLIIDEVSMIDAQTLDMVELVCREVLQVDAPFGGMQVVLVGDFFQLPPIAKEGRAQFAFESKAWQLLSPLICYLSEQHRQEDNAYLSVLAAIRKQSYNDEHEALLLDRKVDVADVEQIGEETVTRLYAHNADVDTINEQALAKLPGLPTVFRMTTKGKSSLVEGLMRGCLSPEVLSLKQQAIVICTKNNKEKGYVNGTTGVVVGFAPGTRYPIIETKDGTEIVVEPASWEVEEDGKVKASITQIPLRLAWAITIHKSQGLSLDRAVMDLSQAFEYGQGYVALSRVRALSGLHILGWNERALQVHPYIGERDELFQSASRSAEVYFADMPQDELNKLQENFIRASGGAITVSKKEKKKSGDTLEDTAVLILTERPLLQIVKERGLTTKTILGHIEKLIHTGRLERADIEYLIPLEVMNALHTIERTFQSYDTSKLAPVHEHFKGRFSYEELQLARAYLLLRKE